MVNIKWTNNDLPIQYKKIITIEHQLIYKKKLYIGHVYIL